MDWKGACSAVAAAAILTQPAITSAQTADSRLVVRIYNSDKIPGRQLHSARRLVDAIFAPVGVQISWIDCWHGEGPTVNSSRCAQPLAINEVVLRLFDAGLPPDQLISPLGFSLVNLQHVAPFLATVYPDRIRLTAKDGRTSFESLLGRVIAHEIGHLLLGRNEHAQTGLMRGHWSGGDLRKDAPADWRFGPGEIAAVQAAAERRNMLPANLAAAR